MTRRGSATLGCGLALSMLVGAPARATIEPAEAAPSREPDDAVVEPETESSQERDSASPTEVEPAADPIRDDLIEEAAHHFAEGTRLVDNGDYGAAAVEFERSYAAIRSAKALYNAGLSYEKAGQPVQAVRVARRYLELPDCGAPDAVPIHCATKREEVEETLRRLMRRVGQLDLVVEPGVDVREVRVQGRTVPLEDFPLVMEPGPVEVTVYGSEDDDLLNRVARLTAGDETRVYVGPFDAPAPRVRTPPPETQTPGETPVRVVDSERRQRVLRGVFWGGLAATLGSGVALGVVGGLTVKARDDYEAKKCGEGTQLGACDPIMLPDGTFEPRFPHPQEEQDRFETYRTATNALIGVTAGLAMVTTVVGLFAFSQRQTPTRRASTTRVKFTGSGMRLKF